MKIWEVTADEYIALETPRLDDIVNKEWEKPITWRQLLKTRELLGERNGVKWYHDVNVHWIVNRGYVFERFGFNGKNLFNKLADNPKLPLSRIDFSFTHYLAVLDAIRAGKKVPKKVLNNYPDLKQMKKSRR